MDVYKIYLPKITSEEMNYDFAYFLVDDYEKLYLSLEPCLVTASDSRDYKVVEYENTYIFLDLVKDNVVYIDEDCNHLTIHMLYRFSKYLKEMMIDYSKNRLNYQCHEMFYRQTNSRFLVDREHFILNPDNVCGSELKGVYIEVKTLYDIILITAIKEYYCDKDMGEACINITMNYIFMVYMDNNDSIKKLYRSEKDDIVRLYFFVGNPKSDFPKYVKDTYTFRGTVFDTFVEYYWSRLNEKQLKQIDAYISLKN